METNTETNEAMMAGWKNLCALADIAIDTKDAAELAATDAAMEPATMHKLIGVECTVQHVSIGSDSYAHVVVAVTPRTIKVNDGRTYRFSTKHGQWRSGRHYRLALGHGENHRDPSF